MSPSFIITSSLLQNKALMSMYHAIYLNLSSHIWNDVPKKILEFSLRTTNLTIFLFREKWFTQS